MTDHQPRPLWPILTVLIGLPVLYVAGFGPACWVLRYAIDHGVSNQGILSWSVSTFYWPMFWLNANGPEAIVRALGWYCTLLP